MAREEYQLLPNEEIILIDYQVSHGHLGSYKDDLILTNQALIIVNRGSYETIKQTHRYLFDDLLKIELNDFTPKIKQLEVHHRAGTEYLLFMTNDEFEIKLWEIAINDQKQGQQGQLRSDYYQEIKKQFNTYVKEVLPREALEEYNRKTGKVGSSSMITQKIKEDIGLPSFKDQFTSVGNDFRKRFGMDTKTTKAEEDLFKKRRAFDKIVQDLKDQFLKSPLVDTPTERQVEKQPLTLDEQVEAVKKLKDLLDAGILTQEEFDKKKKEILNL